MSKLTKNAKPTGFALVAKRVVHGTSNLLVTAVVVVATLAFGQQLTSWWATSPRDSHPDVLASLGPADPASLAETQSGLEVDFGDLPLALGRRAFTGDRAAVFSALRKDCRSTVEHLPPSSRVPGPLEQKMLEQAAHLELVDREPGRWSMVELDGPIPMVVAVSQRVACATPDGEVAPVGEHEQLAALSQPPVAPSDSLATPEVAEAGTRVLSWGFAFPIDEDTGQWTLFTGVPTSDPSTLLADLPALPSPPGSRRSLSLRTQEGGAIVSLEGEGTMQDWIDFFSRSFQEKGWGIPRGWQNVGGVQHCRFEHESRGFAVEILLDVDDRLNAMMTVTPI